jgi:hypothetical protein
MMMQTIQQQHVVATILFRMSDIKDHSCGPVIVVAWDRRPFTCYWAMERLFFIIGAGSVFLRTIRPSMDRAC